MADKSIVFASLLVISLAFMGVSVVGLLQSSERIGASGIVVRSESHPSPSPPPSPSPLPPEPEIEIDVYADPECTQVMSSVEWGSIQVGGSVNRVIYIKNAGDYSVVLSLTTDDWSPVGAADYLALSWDYDGSALGPGGFVRVTLRLSVSSSVSGINSFSFDIVIQGSAT